MTPQQFIDKWIGFITKDDLEAVRADLNSIADPTEADQPEPRLSAEKMVKEKQWTEDKYYDAKVVTSLNAIRIAKQFAQQEVAHALAEREADIILLRQTLADMTTKCIVDCVPKEKIRKAIEHLQLIMGNKADRETVIGISNTISELKQLLKEE